MWRSSGVVEAGSHDAAAEGALAADACAPRAWPARGVRDPVDWPGLYAARADTIGRVHHVMCLGAFALLMRIVAAPCAAPGRELMVPSSTIIPARAEPALGHTQQGAEIIHQGLTENR